MLKSKVRVKLAELDLKQIELANKLQVKPQTLSGWVTGNNAPSLEMAFKLAKILECKVDDLWEIKEEV